LRGVLCALQKQTTCPSDVDVPPSLSLLQSSIVGID